MTTQAITAVWRPHARKDWADVEIVGSGGQHGEQLVLRETGKFWCGVFLAPREQVRICGREFWTGRAA